MKGPSPVCFICFYQKSSKAMKKNRFHNSPFRTASLVALFLIASLTACKKDTDPTPSGSSVEGTWQISAITVSPALSGITDLLAFFQGLSGSDCFSRITFDFKGNGTIDGSVPADCQSTEDLAEDELGIDEQSTWKVQNNKIVLTSGSDVQEYDLTVNATTMNWSYSEVDSDDGKTYTYTIVFKRK
jgi:ABC-type transport system substrate-binding protein